MKHLFVLASLILTMSAEASLSYRYKCECIDTGAECDGIDQLVVLLQDDFMLVQAKDKEDYKGAKFEAKFDSKYRPIKYKNFDRYLVTSDNKKNYPYFLVNKGISKSHWNTGSLKLIEKNTNHAYGWTWEYNCTFDRKAAPIYY